MPQAKEDRKKNYKKNTMSKVKAALDKKMNSPRPSGSYDGSVTVGDIQPAGYAETGPNIGPTGTSDALPIREARKELMDMQHLELQKQMYNNQDSAAKREWRKNLRRNSFNKQKGRAMKRGDKVLSSQQITDMKQDEANTEAITKETAKKTAIAWNKSGLVGVATDLGLKFNKFQNEEDQ